MSLTLTYSGGLSRVQIAITDLPDVDTVTVERSDNGLYWQTVRGASALPVVAGAASLDDYEFTPDVENQYRVVSGLAAGLYLPGTAGSYASTPDDPALDITGDIDLRVDAALTAWDGFGQMLIAKSVSSTGDRSYVLAEDAGAGDARAALEISPDGSTVEQAWSSTAVLPVGNGARLALRGTRAAATGDVDFFTAPGGLDGPWTTLGGTETTTPGAIFAGTAPLEVGSWSNGQFLNAAGVIHRAQVRDGIDGTVVADPDFTEQATDTAQFTDTAGRTWTVHGEARIIADPIYTGSITPNLDGKIWFKSIKHPFLNRPIEVIDWSEVTRSSGTALYRVSGRSTPVAAADQRSAPAFDLEVLTREPETSRDLDLSLVSGDIFLVHLPAGCPVPGGYVSIGDNGIGRRANRTDRRRHLLPCTVVAPPGPGIVPTTLTWRTVFRLYGSWTALLNANPTWRDLLATVGSPDDVVVL